MSDYSELKRLADACPPPGTYHYQSKEWANLMAFQAAVEDIYESDVGMAKELIAEIERLTADNTSLRGSCAKLGAEHAGMVRQIKKLKGSKP
ncbi:MAG: hypothetical protein J6A65_08460 [Pseudomonas sp.]|nr:hypothetical protein [Pseudomonas sp.]MBP3932340.1 hypothetical protein [Pseudomonas sp.]